MEALTAEKPKSPPIITLTASDGMEVSGPNKAGVQAAMARHLSSHPEVKLAKETSV